MCIVISQECKNIIVIQIKKHEKYHLLFFDDIHIFLSFLYGMEAVSYTHLTLPTNSLV